MAKIPDIPAPSKDVSGQTIKVLEEKIINLDKKTEVIEDNILSINQRQDVDIKILQTRLMDVEKEVNITKKRMAEVISELKQFARKSDVESIRKYLELWEPLNFVTRNEFEEEIEKFENRKV